MERTIVLITTIKVEESQVGCVLSSYDDWRIRVRGAYSANVKTIVAGSGPDKLSKEVVKKIEEV